MRRTLLLAAALIPGFAAAQPAPGRVSSVRATGEAVVSAKPDTARLDLGVVTFASTAQAAASQNATQVQAVLDKLHAALGPDAQIRTANYSLNPNYQPPRPGEQPAISGYTASNTVEVTTGELSDLGKLIDAASQAGANHIQGLQFLLRKDAPVRAQALEQAVQAARANAQTMAAAMGMKLGRVLLLEQGAPSEIRPLARMAASLAVAPTPVESGTLEVRATVTLTVELQ